MTWVFFRPVGTTPLVSDWLMRDVIGGSTAARITGSLRSDVGTASKEQVLGAHFLMTVHTLSTDCTENSLRDGGVDSNSTTHSASSLMPSNSLQILFTLSMK